MIHLINLSERLAQFFSPGDEVWTPYAESNSRSSRLERTFEKGYRYAASSIAEEQWTIFRGPMLKLTDFGQAQDATVPGFGQDAIGRIHMDVINTFQIGHAEAYQIWQSFAAGSKAQEKHCKITTVSREREQRH